MIKSLIKGLEVDRSKELRERASVGKPEVRVGESFGGVEIACDKSLKQIKQSRIIKVLLE